MKKKLIAIILSTLILTGCDAFEVETKTLIDYRYNDAHQDISTDINGHMSSTYVPENFELQYEYVYKDGHVERRWERCTRFEYKEAMNELEN